MLGASGTVSQYFDAVPATYLLFGRTQEEICKLGRDGLVDLLDPRLETLLEDEAAKSDRRRSWSRPRKRRAELRSLHPCCS